MKFNYLDFSVEVLEKDVFAIPSDVEVVERYGFYIVVSPSNGTWIILENKEQLEIFFMFMQYESIEMVLKKNMFLEDVQFVVCQLLGKHFCDVYETRIEDNFALRIYLTNNCNLRCSHCFMYAGNKYENELTENEILEIIKLSNEKGANKLILTGGEVCLSETFIPAIKLAKSLSMYVQVLSNGTCWKKEMLDEAAKYIDDIQISVDGYDEESNSAIRGKGMFEKSLSIVQEFVNRKVYTTIVTTPSYDIIDNSMDKYIAFGHKLVNRFGTEYFCVMFGNEIINGRNVKADKIKNITYKNTISKIMENIYPNYALTTFIRNHEYGRIMTNCGYGTLTVSANGDVYFCGRIYDVCKYGNIRDIPKNEIFLLRRNAREYSQVYNIDPCNKCDLRYVCGGGCRIANIPEVTRCDLNKENKMFHRVCTIEEKEQIYRMMIEANDFLLW